MTFHYIVWGLLFLENNLNGIKRFGTRSSILRTTTTPFHICTRIGSPCRLAFCQVIIQRPGPKRTCACVYTYDARGAGPTNAIQVTATMRRVFRVDCAHNKCDILFLFFSRSPGSNLPVRSTPNKSRTY